MSIPMRMLGTRRAFIRDAFCGVGTIALAALLRDEHRAYYQRGLSPSAASFDALLRWHHEYRSDLPHRVLPTMLERGALETLLPNPQ